MLLRIFRFISSFLLLFFSQTSVTAPYDNIYQSIESYFDPTYVTFGGGYDFADNIEFNDIYFEAQAAVNMNWWNAQTNTKREHWACNANRDVCGLYVPVTFVVRQFRSSSSPVKTPTYNPGMRFVYANSAWITDENNFHYITAGFHHYSNGQQGDHFIDGTDIVNTEDGSFSSDYLELAYQKINNNHSTQMLRLKLRTYLTDLTWEEEQTDYHEDALLEATGAFNLRKLFNDDEPGFLKKHMKESELFLTIGYKFGKKYLAANTETEINDNFQYKLEFITKPKAWNDMAWYIRWDKGFDYYNINYRNKINRIQIGLINKPF